VETRCASPRSRPCWRRSPAHRSDGGRIELVAVEGGRCTCGCGGLLALQRERSHLQGVIEPRLRAALGWFEGLSIV